MTLVIKSNQFTLSALENPHHNSLLLSGCLSFIQQLWST